MAICPECKKIIDELNIRRTGIEDARMFIDDGYGNIDNEEFEGDGEADWYNCPKCNEELFNNWDDAEIFLKEKDELAEIVAEKIEANK